MSLKDKNVDVTDKKKTKTKKTDKITEDLNKTSKTGDNCCPFVPS